MRRPRHATDTILEQLGYDLDGLLASAGLDRADVEDPVSPSACARVFARTAKNGKSRIRRTILGSEQDLYRFA
jgi:hypothetical protein